MMKDEAESEGTKEYGGRKMKTLLQALSQCQSLFINHHLTARPVKNTNNGRNDSFKFQICLVSLAANFLAMTRMHVATFVNRSRGHEYLLTKVYFKAFTRISLTTCRSLECTHGMYEWEGTHKNQAEYVGGKFPLHRAPSST